MKPFSTICLVLAGMAGLTTSMPSSDLAVSVDEAPNMIARAPPVDIRVTKRSPGEGDDTTPPSKPGALTDLLQKVLNNMDSGTLDFNQVAQQSIQFVGKSIGTLDLNSLARGVWRGASTLTRSALGTPGNALASVLSAIIKPLVRKIDFNAMAQTMISVLGGFIAILDFNSAIMVTIKLILIAS